MRAECTSKRDAQEHRGDQEPAEHPAREAEKRAVALSKPRLIDAHPCRELKALAFPASDVLGHASRSRSHLCRLRRDTIHETPTSHIAIIASVLQCSEKRMLADMTSHVNATTEYVMSASFSVGVICNSSTAARVYPGEAKRVAVQVTHFLARNLIYATGLRMY